MNDAEVSHIRELPEHAAPGRDTAEGACAVFAANEEIERGYFRDSDGTVKPLPACTTCGREDVRECWRRGHQPLEERELPPHLNGYERDAWRGMKTQSVRDLLSSISHLRTECDRLRGEVGSSSVSAVAALVEQYAQVGVQLVAAVENERLARATIAVLRAHVSALRDT